MADINRLKNMSAAGQRSAALANEVNKPGAKVLQDCPCYIVRMFDLYAQEQDASDYIKNKANSNTGYLYVEVKEIVSGVMRILPLAEPVELVYFVYGNGQQIAGTAARILYVGSDKSNAFVRLAPNPQETYPELGDNGAGISYDIGYIFGGI